MTKLQKIAIRMAIEQLDSMDFSLAAMDLNQFTEGEERVAWVMKRGDQIRNSQEKKRKVKMILESLYEEKDS